MSIKKKVSFLFLLVMFNFTFTSFNFAKAEGIEFNIKYNKNENRYISYNGVSQRFFDYYYTDIDQNFDVYCIKLGLDGAEKTESGYVVNAEKFIEDQNIINILNNGYPHKTYIELGLNNEAEAKFATQFAIWIYTNNLDISKIEALNESTSLVKEAIISIYNMRNSKVYLDTTFSAYEQLSDVIDISGKKYYRVKYKLDIGKDIINVENTTLDSNIKIVADDFSKISDIKNAKTINVIYPVELVKEEKILNLNLNLVYKNLNVRYGIPENSNMQEVALILPEYETKEVSKEINLKYKEMKLKIIKKNENMEVLQGVKFEIYNMDKNESLGEFTTDENGQINIDFRKELNINDEIELEIKESFALPGYQSNDEVFKVKLEYGKTKELQINNKKEIEKVELPKTGM